MKKKILLIIYLISIPNISYAYLDPGLGSYILAMLAAFFAALMAFFNVILEKIKNFLKRIKEIFKKNKN